MGLDCHYSHETWVLSRSLESYTFGRILPLYQSFRRQQTAYADASNCCESHSQKMLWETKIPPTPYSVSSINLTTCIIVHIYWNVAAMKCCEKHPALGVNDLEATVAGLAYIPVGSTNNMPRYTDLSNPPPALVQQIYG